jgi:hypothetical protein
MIAIGSARVTRTDLGEARMLAAATPQECVAQNAILPMG